MKFGMEGRMDWTLGFAIAMVIALVLMIAYLMSKSR